MPTIEILSLFSVQGIIYGVLVPVAIVEIAALILIPSLLRPGAKPKAVVKALFCYAMLGIGVLLMTIGALPTIFSVLTGLAFSGETYIGLLLLFAVGGAVFLWHDNEVRTIDAASRSVPAVLYHFLFKVVGNVLVLLSGLSLALSIILGGTNESGWWITPVIMLIYGLLLSWCTCSKSSASSVFLSTPVATAPAPSKTKKAVAKKTVKKAAPKRKKRR